MLTRAEIQSLLTEDLYYRKTENWPLLTLNDDLNQTFSITRPTAKGMLNLTYYDLINFDNLKDIKQKINNLYPFTNELLKKFKGHVIAAGGAIVKAIYDNHSSTDIDFFFYDLDAEEANRLRLEIIEYLFLRLKEFDPNKQLKFHVERNQYVTTVKAEFTSDLNNKYIIVYQFIHRIYPNISSILGGFDLSVAMVAYDGDNIYSIPLDKWSISHKTIIVDTKRRSTSFEHRLLKYYSHYNIGLLFPGISQEIINGVYDRSQNNFDTLYNKIIEVAQNHNYDFDFYHYGQSDLKTMFVNTLKVNSYQIQKEENIFPAFRFSHKQTWQKITNRPCDRNNIEDAFLNKTSDYGCDYNPTWPACRPHINGKNLRFDRLTAVCSVYSFNQNYNNVITELTNEISNPNVEIDIDHYYEMTRKARSFHNNKKHDKVDPNYDFYKMVKYFGKLAPEVMKVRDTDQYFDYVQIMAEKMIANAKICVDNLVGIKWITENPGRQWTSSINPIIEDPRLWYGKHYIPVLTGIPEEIETCLRLARLRSIWSCLPDDVFNHILLYVLGNCI